MSLIGAGIISCCTRTGGCSRRESSNHSKIRRLTPDIIFGGLHLSRKNVAALRLDCKKFGSAACDGDFGGLSSVKFITDSL